MPAPRFLADEDFRFDIVRALRAVDERIEIMTVPELSLRGVNDAGVLELAAETGRIVLTHDRTTMTAAATVRMTAHAGFPGLIVVPQRVQTAVLVEQMRMIVHCSDATEWVNVISYLPW